MPDAPLGDDLTVWLSSSTAVFAFAAVLWAAAPILAQSWTVQTSGTTASLRGISAVDRNVAWASGNHSAWLRTTDGGASWQAGTVRDAADLDFRAIRALDRNRAWMLSSGPGNQSRIYQTVDGGAQWKLLFTNPDASGFLDALSFWDKQRGIVLGDPVDGQFVILTTRDGGQSWQRHKLPPALPNEGAFAASNSCLTVRGKREAWFVTGGATSARLFHSKDGGDTWEIFTAPIRHGAAGAGIFSLTFADSLHGIVSGGDYSKPGESEGNVAVSADGGRSWSEPTGTHPNGYRSAVTYLSGHKLWVAVGTSGSDVSRDGGQNWKSFDTGAFNAIAATAHDVAWAVGPKGRIARLEIK